MIERFFKLQLWFMSTTCAQPEGALEMAGRSILPFHLDKREGRAADRYS